MARRTIVTDAFVVAPELIGLPLASPSRRALAMGIDLILISILIQIGGAALLGFAGAFVLWRISRRTAAGMVRASVRNLFRILAGVILFVVVVNVSNDWFDGDESAENDNGDESASMEVNFDTGDLNLGIGETLRLGRMGMALRDEDDAADANRMADSMVTILRAGGASANKLAELRIGVHEFTGSNDNEVVRAAINRAFNVTDSAGNDRVGALTAQLSAAIEKEDSTTRDSLQRELRMALAGDELRAVRRRNEQLERRNDELEEQAERAGRNRGFRSIALGFADDLGLGFGWFALYFTASLALMRGQTPGKRIMHIRVLRLDARAITWWIAFERFGGYAASATLGLLGFLQILWDRNRQGLHDKAVETVVMHEVQKQP